MLGTTPEDLAQFLHQEERLDSVRTSTWVVVGWGITIKHSREINGIHIIYHTVYKADCRAANSQSILLVIKNDIFNQ